VCCAVHRALSLLILGRMVSLPAELWGLVDEQVALQATFAEFVMKTLSWSASRKRQIFSMWAQELQVGSASTTFTGTPAELQFVRDHVDGK
jgi:hypothetical protein